MREQTNKNNPEMKLFPESSKWRFFSSSHKPPRSSSTRVVFITIDNETSPGFHPRDKTLPFSPALSGAVLSAQGIGSILLEFHHSNLSSRKSLQFMNGHEGLVVFEINPGQFETVKTIINSLEKRPKRIAAYGLSADSDAETMLQSGYIDYCVNGEPEAVIPGLAKWLSGKTGSPPAGILYLEKDRLSNTGEAPPVCTDDMPFIPLSLVKSDRYFKNSFPLSIGKQLRWGFILANRGCPFSCRFCTSMTRQSQGNEYRTCKPERVVSEMRHQVKFGNRTIISIEDDLFTGNRDWTMDFCMKLRASGLNTPWIAQTRFDCLDKELIRELSASGCVGLTCGLESGSDRILDKLNKKLDLDTILKSSAEITNAGIALRCTAMIGCPSETYDDLRKTARVARTITPLTLQVSFCTPYPDTDLTPVVSDIREPVLRFEKPVDNLSSIPGRDLPRLRTKLYRRFYFSRGYLSAHLRTWLGFVFCNPWRALSLVTGFMLFTLKSSFLSFVSLKKKGNNKAARRHPLKSN